MKNHTDKFLILLLVGLVVAYIVYLQQKDPGETISEVYPQVVPDTVKPVMATTHPESIYPNLFEAAFAPFTVVSQGTQKFSFRTFELGKLNCTSGKIIACDMINMHASQPFTQLFPVGNFSVQLALAKHKEFEIVAFSRILFSTDSVVRWELALLPGQKPIALNDSDIYCYPVDAAMAIFIDSASNVSFSAQGQEAWNDAFINQPEERLLRGYMHAFGSQNVAVFSTGGSDGCYATYIGFDANDKPCRLLTDFGLIYWWNIQKE